MRTHEKHYFAFGIVSHSADLYGFDLPWASGKKIKFALSFDLFLGSFLVANLFLVSLGMKKRKVTSDSKTKTNEGCTFHLNAPPKILYIIII